MEKMELPIIIPGAMFPSKYVDIFLSKIVVLIFKKRLYHFHYRFLKFHNEFTQISYFFKFNLSVIIPNNEQDCCYFINQLIYFVIKYLNITGHKSFKLIILSN